MVRGCTVQAALSLLALSSFHLSFYNLFKARGRESAELTTFLEDAVRVTLVLEGKTLVICGQHLELVLHDCVERKGVAVQYKQTLSHMHVIVSLRVLGLYAWFSEYTCLDYTRT